MNVVRHLAFLAWKESSILGKILLGAMVFVPNFFASSTLIKSIPGLSEGLIIPLTWSLPISVGLGLLWIVYSLSKLTLRQEAALTKKINITFCETDCISLAPEGVPDSSGRIQAKYIKLRLSVPGSVPSKGCRVDLVNIEKAGSDDGNFVSIGFTDSYQLGWSAVPPEQQFNELEVRQGIPRYAVLFSVNEKENKIKLSWQVRPYKYEHVFDEAGKYRFSIKATSEEIGEPDEIRVVLAWRGKWDDFNVYKDGDETCLEGNI